jgi:hypothetical protein
MDQRTAWSAAGGVVTATCGTNAAAWAVGAASSGSPLPSWPAFIFGAIALVGLYVTFAAILRIWPLHRLRVSSAELLDGCIRHGREARSELVYGKQLDAMAMSGIAAEFYLATANRLDYEFPAIADEFTLAAGDQSKASGQVLLINTINEKLRVLIEARKGIG